MTVFCQSGVCALRWAGEAEGRPPRSRQFFCHNSQAKFSQGAGFSQAKFSFRRFNFMDPGVLESPCVLSWSARSPAANFPTE